jgi:hypothetical protein
VEIGLEVLVPGREAFLPDPGSAADPHRLSPTMPLLDRALPII